MAAGLAASSEVLHVLFRAAYKLGRLLVILAGAALVVGVIIMATK